MATREFARFQRLTRTSVLLLMVSGTMLAVSGCATTPQEWVTDTWEHYRNRKEKLAAVTPKDSSKPKTGNDPRKKFTASDKSKTALARKSAPAAKRVSAADSEDSDENAAGERADRSESLAGKEDLPKSNLASAENPADKMFGAKKPKNATSDTDSKDILRASGESDTVKGSSDRRGSAAAAAKKPQTPVEDPFSADWKSESRPDNGAPKSQAKDDENPFDDPSAEPAKADPAAAVSEPSTEEPAANLELNGGKDADRRRKLREARYRALFNNDSASTQPEVPNEAANVDNPFGETVNENPTEAVAMTAHPQAGQTAPDLSANNARLQAEALTLRARVALKRDNLADAVRLATAAQKLEVEYRLEYDDTEERPSAFLKRLNHLRQAGTSVAPARNATAPKLAAANSTEVASPVESDLARHQSAFDEWDQQSSRSSASANLHSDANAAAESAGPSKYVSQRTQADSERSSAMDRQAVLQVQANRPLSTPEVAASQTGPSLTAPQKSQYVAVNSQREGTRGQSSGQLGQWSVVPEQTQPETVATRDEAPPVEANSAELTGPVLAAPEPPAMEPALEIDRPAKLSKFSERKSRKFSETTLAAPTTAAAEPAFPMTLVVGFVVGMIGVCGFGLWRRLQIQHFVPRS